MEPGGAGRPHLPACRPGGERDQSHSLGTGCRVPGKSGEGRFLTKGMRSEPGRDGVSRTHLSPSLSHDKLTGGLLLTLTHVKFKASPGRSVDALAKIVTLVGGTSGTGGRSEAQR